MSRSTPSLLALLGMVAVAGYQNRDKLAGMMGGGAQPQGGAAPSGGQGTLAGLGDMFKSGASGGGGIAGGLGELVERFRQGGKGQAADSWVSTGANHPVAAGDIEQVLGSDTIADLVQKTGLTREDLLNRLETALPATVDHLTPGGRLPTEDEANRIA